MMPLSPGDFLDRFAVLTVKRKRFDISRAALVEEEYRRYVAASYTLLQQAGAREAFAALVAVHDAAFVVLEEAVPAALAGDMTVENHITAIRLNRERVVLKQKIDAALAPGSEEVKSYYGG